ncbi:MAG: enoyl-CoA hydratase [Microbacteriaceae bacterium BACL25 MAG-120322-bin65]|mgnify:FL=1|jgi:enoyl-CoA hydratase|nr:MAG: enoyl-CoA hydratase [Microbacteriaceae bacterium BACL25 MAG-120322-bin65]
MNENQDLRVTLEIRGHVLFIGLNRVDKRNAADRAMLDQLSLAYGELERNPELRVGVVHAHGEHFSAGLDLVDVGPELARGGAISLPEGGLDPWGITSTQVSKPVVMAIQGICYTLGVELALASDVVIAREGASFAQLEVSRGILPFGGATTRMPRVTGWSNAMRWLLTADTFSAAEAHRIGIVTEVVDVDPLERATEIALRIAQQAPLAVAETLASARAGQIDPGAEAAQLGTRLGRLMATRDVQRGMEAFMTKAPASFEGD